MIRANPIAVTRGWRDLCSIIPLAQKRARTRSRIYRTRRYERETERAKCFCVALYRRRRGRRLPIGGFRGLEAICPLLRCYLFICPPVIYCITYVWIRVIYPNRAIKIPARADTSGIIRSSKQDCPDDSDFSDPPPSFPHPSSTSPLLAPFLGRSRCGQSREPF